MGVFSFFLRHGICHGLKKQKTHNAAHITGVSMNVVNLFYLFQNTVNPLARIVTGVGTKHYKSIGNNSLKQKFHNHAQLSLMYTFKGTFVIYIHIIYKH